MWFNSFLNVCRDDGVDLHDPKQTERVQTVIRQNQTEVCSSNCFSQYSLSCCGIRPPVPPQFPPVAALCFSDSNTSVNITNNKRVSLFYQVLFDSIPTYGLSRYFLKCMCSVVCPGTSVLVGQHPSPISIWRLSTVEQT